MIHLPFINKYPYTSMEAVNIDWLLNEVSKIPVLEDKVNQHETRITDLETTVSDHETRLTAAEGDIDALEGRMDTAEGDIDQLQDDMSSVKDRVTAAERDISSLVDIVGNSTSGLVKDVSDLQSDVSDIQQDIIDINTKDQAQDNDIDGLDSRVTALEEASAVIANPGGIGANLNTISIDDVTYVIPSGGGGGGGSSVTPNPSGTATDTVEKVDIDGTIYDLPISTTEVTQITNDITQIQGDVSDIQDDLDDNINILSSSVSGWSGGVEHEFEGMTDGTIQDITDAHITITEPGTYLFILNATFDTRNFGSSARDLGLYLRRYKSDPQVPDPFYNLGLAKAHVNGTETAMITQAFNLNLMRSAVVSTSMIQNGDSNFKASFRVNSNSNKNVVVSSWCTCIKLNGYDPDA